MVSLDEDKFMIEGVGTRCILGAQHLIAIKWNEEKEYDVEEFDKWLKFKGVTCNVT